MLSEVFDLMREQGFPIQDYLIQNPEPMKHSKSPKHILLRWRHRLCVSCNVSFDIEKEGRFYRCGDCV